MIAKFKFSKRILSFVLSLIMLFALLSGCENSAVTGEDISKALDSIGEALDSIPTTDNETPEESSPVPDTGLPDESEDEQLPSIDEGGSYTSKDDVALYIQTYGKLPSNFISKSEARAAGWSGGSLEPYFPGCCIGGDRFGNYESLLPTAEGRTYTECDIDTLGKDSRGAKRIVFSNDGLIFYTDDHYESFTQLNLENK